MDLDARILVTGQCGWVGGAVMRRLWAAGFDHIRWLGPDEVDLARAASVDAFFQRHRPDYVFLTAAREGAAGEVGQGESTRRSLAVQANVIHAAWRSGVRKLCFLASSSIHPAGALPPLREGALLAAAIAPGQNGDVLAQLAGIRMCQAYRRQYRFDAIGVVPAELYGSGDGPGARAGALPALLRRLHEAQAEGLPELAVEAVPARAWLQVDDFADAALFLMRRYSSDVPVNVDGEEEVAFADLARIAAEAVGYRGRLVHPARTTPPPRPMPEGVRLNGMGWAPCMPLREGIGQMCARFLQGAGVPA
ncbi:MAG TPA: NAD-dependent epimerase/dehydratase family protein [Frateuria sp.]|uniref:NAD-dependent epimerase/dehydratase family protein n=1 Tax=Frateuria sp. TaxID=2211372 RepID=UPI002D7EA0DF|nr:NAD-dependent epimerase/dehydratase family protein [Frateuria sp.]HET6804769.1 NAD-dependent epimerase/dehydratase family protein [Frateuria sp.]